MNKETMKKIKLGKEIGERVRKYRKQCGLTQNGLGQKIPCDASVISRLESGKIREIDKETLLKLCAALNMTLEQLLYEKMSDSEKENICIDIRKAIDMCEKAKEIMENVLKQL